MHYLDIPLSVILKINRKINVYAGPYLGPLIYGGTYNKKTYTDEKSSWNNDVGWRLMNYPEVGWIIGASINTNVKFTSVSLQNNDIQIPDKVEISEKMNKDRIASVFAPLSKKEVKVVKTHN